MTTITDEDYFRSSLHQALRDPRPEILKLIEGGLAKGEQDLLRYVMKAGRGHYNPKMVRDILEEQGLPYDLSYSDPTK